MTAATADTGLTAMFEHPFMQNAFIAGTGIAMAAGLVGYFLVLRAQVFTADALSHVAFTGALAALATGIDARVGLFAATVAVGCALGALGALGPRGHADDVVIGSVFAWVLGLGVLFLTLYTTPRNPGTGTAGVTVLFGSIFGLDASHAWEAAILAVILCLATIAIGRPLLFASLDGAVAAARGVPVRLLGVGFLGLVGATAADATQAVGALLLLGMLAAPAGTAHRLTAHPYHGMMISTAVAVAVTWVGLTTSYLAPRIPPSFAILATATATYTVTLIVTRLVADSGLARPVRHLSADAPRSA